MHYHPLTAEDKQSILKEIGVSSFEALIQEIPAALRDPKIDLTPALSELELQPYLKDIASKNKTVRDYLSFLGGGSYDHFIPSAVGNITNRNEFATAYTPYQAEASQGTLQAIYEYQSLITELTGLDVSNASHYDGATSIAEAALLALKQTDRNKILLSQTLHPHYVRVIKTYLEGTPYQVEMFGCREDGTWDREDLLKRVTGEVAGAIFQSPNFLGAVEDLEGISDALHQAGALMMMAGHPLSYSIYKSPGEWGADIAAGEGQPLGIPMEFGGPYLGYFAVSRALMRRIPGRLAGLTTDTEGQRAFCLTLQAREQHIRRERAASNICTNQALCALAACVYMTLLGKEGMAEVAEMNVDRATYLREKIGALKGFKTDSSIPIFNEFVVRTDKDLASLQAKLFKKNIFPGIDLSQFYPERKNQFLVCATETKTHEDLDRFVEALDQC